jgi:FixJ family two-component response regulator
MSSYDGSITHLLYRFAACSTCAFWIADVDAMSILYCNVALWRMLGVSDDAIRTVDTWQASVHPADRAARDAALASVGNGATLAHDYRVVLRSGAVRTIHETCFPFDGQLDGRRCAGGICEDVTVETSSAVYLIDSSGKDSSLPQILQAAGHPVRRFESAATLLGIANGPTPGCLVLVTPARHAELLTAIHGIRALRADLPLIVVGDCGGDVSIAIDAIKAGAADFLQTPVSPQSLLRAIAGGLHDPMERARADKPVEMTRARIAQMSPRERQVLSGLLAGGTNKSIGQDLGLSPRTIEGHRSRVMDRLGARSLAEAALMSAAAGVAAMPDKETPR